ncbi:MAG: hypothetical protein WBE18_01730 [Gammaproteobacteria bacterium]
MPKDSGTSIVIRGDIEEESNKPETQRLLPKRSDSSGSPVKEIILQTIEEFSKPDKPHSPGYKIGGGLVVILVAASTIPFNWTYASQYAKTEFVKQLPAWLPLSLRPTVILMVPISNVAVNIGQTTFSMMSTWDGLAKIFTSKESVTKKAFRAGAAVILCVFPSSPIIAAAFLEKNTSALWGWLNKIGTIICTIPFAYYSALTFLQDTGSRIFLGVKRVFSSDQVRWQHTLMLKSIYLGMLADQCEKFRDNAASIRIPNSKNDFSTKNTARTTFQDHLVNLRSNVNLSENINKPFAFFQKVSTFFTGQSVKKIAQKIPEMTVQAPFISILIGSWAGYQCALRLFWQEKADEFWPEVSAKETAIWIALIMSMLPLYYVSAKLGYTAISTLFKRCIFRQVDTDLPYCLKYYRKTTLLLGVAVVALSALTYAIGIELINEACPAALQEVMKILTYPGSPGFNSMISLKLIDSVMMRFTLHKYDDDKKAEKIITFLETIMKKIEKMPPRKFAQSVRAEKLELFLHGLRNSVSPQENESEKFQKLIAGSELELHLDDSYRNFNKIKMDPKEYGGVRTAIANKR